MAFFGKKKDTEKDFLEVKDLEVDGPGDYGPAGSPKTVEPTPDLPMPDLALSAPQPNTSQRDLDLINSKLSILKADIELLKERMRLFSAREMKVPASTSLIQEQSRSR